MFLTDGEGQCDQIKDLGGVNFRNTKDLAGNFINSKIWGVYIKITLSFIGWKRIKKIRQYVLPKGTLLLTIK